MVVKVIWAGGFDTVRGGGGGGPPRVTVTDGEAYAGDDGGLYTVATMGVRSGAWGD